MSHHESQQNAAPPQSNGGVTLGAIALSAAAPGGGEETSLSESTALATSAAYDGVASGEPPSCAWLEYVRRRVAAIRFGSIQIVIHDGKVTQVEQTEKIRFSGR